MVSNIENITKAEREMAQSSIELLEKNADKLNRNGSNSIEIPIGDSGEVAHIPVKVFNLLKTVLGDVAEGKIITVESHEKEINVEEAAKIFFHLAPRHVEELLDKGEISYRQEGGKKLMKLGEVLKYDEKLKIRRRNALQEMVRLSEEMGLYDMENHMVKK